MKYQIYILAIIFTAANLFAGAVPKDSIVSFKPNWKRGEELLYKLTTTNTTYFNSDSSEKRSEYTIRIKVKEKNLSGYVLEIPGEKIEDLSAVGSIPLKIRAKLDSLMSDVPIIYKTDTNGVFIDIINQYQLKYISTKLYEMAFADFDTVGDAGTKLNLKNLKEYLPRLYSFYDQFKNVLTLLHFAMGAELKIGEIYSGEINLPSPITGTSIPVFQEFHVSEYNADDESATLEVEQEFDPIAAATLVKGISEKANRGLNTSGSVNYPDSVFIVKYYEINMDMKTKWPNWISAETMVEYRQSAERTVLELELIDDKNSTK